MNIKYITNIRIPTSRAQGYAVMKMCGEFAANNNVQLIIPNRVDTDLLGEEPFAYYGLKNNFVIHKIPIFDLLGKTLRFGKVFYWLDVAMFFIASKFFVRIKQGDVLYSRDFLTAVFYPKTKNLFLELHDIPQKSFLFKFAIKRPRAFFVLNNNIKKELTSFGVSSDKIFISPSGVDLEDFDINLSKEEARKEIDLPINDQIVVYTGHLYPWKGVDILARTAILMPDTTFVFVGGVEPEFSAFKNNYGKYKNIIIRSFAKRSIIPKYLKSADALVIPNSAKEKISSNYTSPLKLFEYMASKRPIVVSNLPSMREVLDESCCVFTNPDDIESMKGALEKVLNNSEFSEDLLEKAFELVKKYSWQEKAKNILQHIHEISS